MATDVIISFGTGKDYSNFATLRTALMAMDLVATNTRVVVELYEDVVGGQMNFYPATADQDCYILFRPAAGLGHADLDPTGPLDFGISGVGFTGGYWTNVGAGIVFDGLRLNPGIQTSGIRIGHSTGPTSTALSEIRKCKILLASNNTWDVMDVSASGRTTDLFDNLLIVEDVVTYPIVTDRTNGRFERNTVIRRGDAAGTGPGYHGGLSDNARSRALDNVFINCTDSPIGAQYGNFSSGVRLQNNYSNAPLATNVFTQNMTYSDTMVVDEGSDYRLHPSSPAVAGASAYAENTLDLRREDRGVTPNAGAVQEVGDNPADPPTATVTDQTVPDGQTQRFVGTTTDATSGSYTLTGTNGGVTVGPLPFEIEGDEFDFVVEGLVPGDYAPTLTVTGPGGTAGVTGASAFSIVGVDGGGEIDPGTAAVQTDLTISYEVLESIWSDLVVSYSVEGTADTKTATITLVDVAGAAGSNLTGLKWAWFDQVTPDLFGSPADSGTAEVTDANGTLTIELTNSSLTSGQAGWLIVTNSDGNPETVHKAFSGPVVVD